MSTEPLVAYIYGDTPPDFEAIAAVGFDIVCLDSAALWYSETMFVAAKKHGLTAFAFRMGYVS